MQRASMYNSGTVAFRAAATSVALLRWMTGRCGCSNYGVAPASSRPHRPRMFVAVPTIPTTTHSLESRGGRLQRSWPLS